MPDEGPGPALYPMVRVGQVGDCWAKQWANGGPMVGQWWANGGPIVLVVIGNSGHGRQTLLC